MINGKKDMTSGRCYEVCLAKEHYYQIKIAVAIVVLSLQKKKKKKVGSLKLPEVILIQIMDIKGQVAASEPMKKINKLSNK